MAYTDIDNPELYFQTKLYTGTGSELSITLDGDTDMQPDWVWIKERNGATNQMLTDSVRGATKTLHSQNTDTESTDAQALKSFNSNGFTVGTDGDVNTSSDTYVSWNWKAGTSFTNDASATGIGTIDSAGSVNTTAGFSIVSYTGTGSNGTIAHGLGVSPSWIVTKKRSATGSWVVYHKSQGATKFGILDTTASFGTSSSLWNNTEPTSSVFSVGTDADTNGSSATFIAYCFAEKKGYSKFGSYTGNGNADGTFVYTGFKPAFVIIKRSSGVESWYTFDNKRDTFNVVSHGLVPNQNIAEFDASALDFTSNGFKIRTSAVNYNTSGDTYIYMAFAENPFVTSGGSPSPAR
jgi:hypothetical protein